MSKLDNVRYSRAKILVAFVLLFGIANAVNAASTDIANVPMAVANLVTPNVLIVFDNSQSMDAYMGGTMVSGNDPATRSNIGRAVMRNAITAYQSAFNWGLMTYQMTATPPALFNTYAYYLGNDQGMVFTDDCTGFVAGNPPTVGTSATNGGRRCIANPQPFQGGNFVTFDATGDDANILDVLYDPRTYTTAWALSTAGTQYNVNTVHALVNSWDPTSFSGGCGQLWGCPWSFTPTDAGYTSSNPPITRQVYTPRGWGYNQDITGVGNLDEPIQGYSASHITTLNSKLAGEVNDSASSEVKNGAVFTPLRGTLQSAKTYFSSSLSGQTSPVQYSCQQNFVMLVTDGLPTGTVDGHLYSSADRTNTCLWNTATNSCTSGAFGGAANDAISAVQDLRAITVTGQTSIKKDGTGVVTGKYDVQTYVVGLGDTVANPLAISAMNAMAYNGGTKQAIGASDATAFANAITKIADDISAKVGAAATVAVANSHVSSSDSASYASSYNSGTWTGDINSYTLDTATGVPSATPSWTASAANQLDLRTSANRYIVTSTDAVGAPGGVQFQPTTAATATKLSTAQQSLLDSPTLTDGATVLAYLRGDRSGETAGTYRTRSHLLGDIINGEPVLVREPSASYADTGYDAFKTSKAARTRMLFQGANDGMLHAFNALTGAESWAYVPNLVMANLNNLSRKSGFAHMYNVDGTPVTNDVDFGNMDSASSGASADWHTILVGGLGKGGRGYYALDITDTTAASEQALTSKVLWEFPNSVTNATARATAQLNMGYSFGKPIIVKTAAVGWVVLVTSGYNNGTNLGDSGGDGLGHLYVLDPKTGDLIKDIPTTGCAVSATSNPCGLAQISAYVESTLDNTTDYVYGGDLKGNVWRFDLTGNTVGTDANGWSASLFAKLADASGVAQPITTAPELTDVSNMRMVLVGTGQYLGNSDVATTQIQTMYGLHDSLVQLQTPLRSHLQRQTLTTSGSNRTLSNNPVDYAAKVGWYIDLPSSGERVNTDPVIGLGALVFTTNIPSAIACQPGGSSWEYFVNIKTGGLVDYSTVPWSGVSFGDVLASRPVLIQLPSGEVVSLVRTSDAQTKPVGVPITPPAGPPRRISWRELFR